MPIETIDDTRSLFDSLSTGVSAYLGGGHTVPGVFDQVFDDDLEINGWRTGLRVVRADADLVEIGATIKIIDAYSTPAVVSYYILRAKEVGQRTTLLVLEAT